MNQDARQLDRNEVTYTEWLLQSVDGRFYAKLLRVKPSVIRLYFIWTIVVAVTVSSIAIAFYSYQILGTVAMVFREHFSPMEFTDGQLKVLGPVPIDYARQDFQIIVDPGAEHRSLDPLFSSGLVLLSDRLAIHLPGGASQSFSYRSLGIGDWSLDARTILDSRMISAWLVLVLSAGLRMIGWFIAKTFQVFVGAALVGIISEIRRIKLNHGLRLSLAATALVPPIFLHCIQVVFRMIFPGSIYLYSAVYIFFLVMGTRNLVGGIHKSLRSA
ncbi:DUF1189 family protein [bacterium]|nr:DUF1189 family protein [candidate division CSSED10-310 bacterium]